MDCVKKKFPLSKGKFPLQTFEIIVFLKNVKIYFPTSNIRTASPMIIFQISRIFPYLRLFAPWAISLQTSRGPWHFREHSSKMCRSLQLFHHVDFGRLWKKCVIVDGGGRKKYSKAANFSRWKIIQAKYRSEKIWNEF